MGDLAYYTKVIVMAQQSYDFEHGHLKTYGLALQP
jgi:hypothetical protein